MTTQATYQRLKSEGRCGRCGRMLDAGVATRLCQHCKVRQELRQAEREALRQEDAELATSASLRSETVILAEVARGERCPRCWLVTPCGGHETLSLEWHASRRRGESGQL